MSERLHAAEQVERSGFWSGALAGTVLGMGTLLAYQYFSGILRQPRLISKEIFSDEMQFDNREALAMFIAAENLRSGVYPRLLTGGLSKQVLHAGYRNFRESWARDFGFATYGLLALEQFDVVKDTLNAFFWYQTARGQLPVKLHSMNVVTRFLHTLFGREQSTETVLKPKYISGHGALSLDGQAMLIVAALTYVSQSEDRLFLKRHWEHLKLAVQWLENNTHVSANLLLHQEAYADWADSVARKGNVLYTNVIYWKALTELAATARDVDAPDVAEYYRTKADRLLKAIQDEFWRSDKGYFITSRNLEQLSSAGNLLAIAWGLATAEQTASIFKVMEEAEMADPIPTCVAHPAYPKELITIENRLGGLANYHTDAAWLWIGAWHVIALTNAGKMDQAQTLIDRIVDVIIRDRQVNEVYGPDGNPLESLWYKSESPLTWNAGMVLYAYKVFEDQQNPATSFLARISEMAG